jgi:hypothetical protein
VVAQFQPVVMLRPLRQAVAESGNHSRLDKFLPMPAFNPAGQTAMFVPGRKAAPSFSVIPDTPEAWAGTQGTTERGACGPWVRGLALLARMTVEVILQCPSAVSLKPKPRRAVARKSIRHRRT